jgi:hypothetical protein
MKLSALLFLMPLLANAQVNRCESLDGEITFTDGPCPASDEARPAVEPQVRVVRPPSPFLLSMARAGAQSAPDRLETVRIMLLAGKLSQARLFSRSEEERALVRDMERGRGSERKRRPLAAH